MFCNYLNVGNTHNLNFCSMISLNLGFYYLSNDTKLVIFGSKRTKKKLGVTTYY